MSQVSAYPPSSSACRLVLAVHARFLPALSLTLTASTPADSKEGADSDLDKYLPEADVVITTPFHPGYLSSERLAKANKLKLALTAGIGSDHVDLDAAAKNGVTVAEITGVHILLTTPPFISAWLRLLLQLHVLHTL